MKAINAMKTKKVTKLSLILFTLLATMLLCMGTSQKLVMAEEVEAPMISIGNYTYFYCEKCGDLYTNNNEYIEYHKVEHHSTSNINPAIPSKTTLTYRNSCWEFTIKKSMSFLKGWTNGAVIASDENIHIQLGDDEGRCEDITVDITAEDGCEVISSSGDISITGYGTLNLYSCNSRKEDSSGVYSENPSVIKAGGNLLIDANGTDGIVVNAQIKAKDKFTKEEVLKSIGADRKYLYLRQSNPSISANNLEVSNSGTLNIIPDALTDPITYVSGYKYNKIVGKEEPVERTETLYTNCDIVLGSDSNIESGEDNGELVFTCGSISASSIECKRAVIEEAKSLSLASLSAFDGYDEDRDSSYGGSVWVKNTTITDTEIYTGSLTLLDSSWLMDADIYEINMNAITLANSTLGSQEKPVCVESIKSLNIGDNSYSNEHSNVFCQGKMTVQNNNVNSGKLHVIQTDTYDEEAAVGYKNESDDGCDSPNNPTKGNITLKDGASLTIEGKYRACSGMGFTLPEGYRKVVGKNKDSEGNYYVKPANEVRDYPYLHICKGTCDGDICEIVSMAEYNLDNPMLYIGGVKYSESATGDKWIYDREKNKLTLNDGCLLNVAGPEYAAIYSSGNLNIELNGSVKINTTEYDSSLSYYNDEKTEYSILAENNLNISGDGTLIIVDKFEEGGYIKAEASLSIDKTNIKHGDDEDSDYDYINLTGLDNISVKDSKLTDTNIRSEHIILDNTEIIRLNEEEAYISGKYNYEEETYGRAESVKILNNSIVDLVEVRTDELIVDSSTIKCDYAKIKNSMALKDSKLNTESIDMGYNEDPETYDEIPLRTISIENSELNVTLNGIQYCTKVNFTSGKMDVLDTVTDKEKEKYEMAIAWGKKVKEPVAKAFEPNDPDFNIAEGYDFTKRTTDHVVIGPKSYTAKLDANGGEVSPATKTVTYTETYGELPTPTRAGYEFLGWFLGENQVTSATNVGIGDVTLTAKWKQTIDPNHAHVAVEDKYQDPTCVNPGKTEGSHCSLCGKVLVVQREIKALGHNLDAGTITKEATADEKGELTYKCLRSGCEYTEMIIIPSKKEAEDVVAEDSEILSNPDKPLTDTTINIIGVKDATYTGKAITFDIRVYVGKTLLKEGRDYTVKYANNKNVAPANAAPGMTPHVIITGKGAYKDANTYKFEPVYFAINPIDIAELEKTGDAVVGDTTVLKVNGNNSKYVKPVPLVSVEGKKLTKSDLSIDYGEGNAQGIDTTVAKDNTITITGKGNYTGTVTSSYDVVENTKDDPAVLISKATVTGLQKSVKIEDGQEATQSNLTIACKIDGTKVALVENTDYTINYIDNKEIGTASMIISAMEGNDKGLVGQKIVNYKITGVTLSKCQITSPTKVTYTGETIKPGMKGQPELTIYDPVNKRNLDYGQDFEVEYSKNVQAGTAKMIITGKGNYSGKVNKNFKIEKVNFKRAYENDKTVDAKITSVKLVTEGKYAGTYRGDVEVTYNGKVLKPDTDYLLVYKNNKAPGSVSDGKNAPAVKIRGKGNYDEGFWLYFDIKE